jgi:hypothetical protein
MGMLSQLLMQAALRACSAAAMARADSQPGEGLQAGGSPGLLLGLQTGMHIASAVALEWALLPHIAMQEP